MANPFTCSELHSKDLKRARAFHGELFDWKLSAVPGREYLMVEPAGGAGSARLGDLIARYRAEPARRCSG